MTGGIFSIVAGTLDIAFGIVLLFLGGTLAGTLAMFGVPELFAFVPFPILLGIAAPFFILGTLAIVGGSCAVRHKTWPLALAGAICALFPPQLMILGVLAIVFIILGKDEFD